MICKVFGLCCDATAVPGYKKKLIINPYVLPVVNAKNQYIIRAHVAQKSIKAFINSTYSMENVTEISVK